MGLNLFHFLFVSLLLSGCLPQSNFKQSSEEITEEPGTNGGVNGGTTSGTTSGTTNTDTNLGVTNMTISPPGTLREPSSSYYTKIGGDVSSTVDKVFIYVNGCSASAVAVEKDGSALTSGVDGDTFEQMGVELDLTSTPPNTVTKIYLKTKKINGTETTCVHRYSYVHDIEAPVSFASVSTDGSTWSNVFPPAPSTNNRPKIKLAVEDDLVNRVQLFVGSCTANVIEHPTTTWVNTGVEVPLAEGANRIFAKGLGASGYSTVCREIVQYTVDTAPPTMADIQHNFLSTSTTQSPEMNWPASTDTLSGFSHYMYSIGTSKGATNVKGWTRTNDNTDFVVENLNLSVGSTYFMNIQAFDNAGKGSSVISSAQGWKVVDQLVNFAITKPASGLSVGSRTLTLEGTCIAGVEIRRTATTNIEGSPSFTCASNNTFNISVQIKGTKNPTDERTVTLVQSDGKSDHTKSVTVKYDPLSEYGTQLATGPFHNCAVRGTSLYCWGKGLNGKLGLSNEADTVNPRRVGNGGMGDATYEQVSTGINHTCALNTNKEVYCWGSNSQKQLARSTITGDKSLVPIYVANNFKQISAGGKHTCGIKADDTVHCWGHNDQKELGPTSTGTTSVTLVSVSMPNNRTPLQISAGTNHTCVRTNTNEIFCWGHQHYGKLGNGVNLNDGLRGATAQVARVEMTPLEQNENFTYVTAGHNHTCALTNQERVYCWGLDNKTGALGVNFSAVTALTTPPSVSVNEYLPPPTDVKFKAVSAGGNYETTTHDNTCAITTTGQLYCWGSNESGQVGNGSLTKAVIPQRVNIIENNEPVSFQEVSVGSRHVCARSVANEIYCWGLKSVHVLGNIGAADLQTSPIKVVGWEL